MGQIEQRVGVSNGNGGREQTVLALVDTGATHTVLPDSLLREQLGIEPKREEVFTFGDGRTAKLFMGEALIRVAGREATSPVVFGAEGQFLLGATTLQVLNLIPDTTHHTLIPAPRLLI